MCPFFGTFFPRVYLFPFCLISLSCIFSYFDFSIDEFSTFSRDARTYCRTRTLHPPNHISLKPYLSFDPCIYLLCSKGRNAKRRIKVQDDLSSFLSQSRAVGLGKLPTKTITLFHTCVWISYKVPVLSL